MSNLILDAEALFALPDGTILKHPKMDVLVERFHRTPEQWKAMGSANVADAIRLGGNLQSRESLHPGWDFPMTVLYEPNVAPLTGLLLTAELVRMEKEAAWDEAARMANDFVRLDDGIEETELMGANPYRSQA